MYERQAEHARKREMGVLDVYVCVVGVVLKVSRRLSPGEILNGLCESLLQWYLRCPIIEMLLRFRDIRFSLSRIIGWYGFIDDFRIWINHRLDRLSQLLDRIFIRITEIHGTDEITVHQTNQGIDHVVDVAEAGARGNKETRVV